jgi:hypothetical protein
MSKVVILLFNRKIRPKGTIKAFTAFWLALLTNLERNCPKSKRESNFFKKKKIFRVGEYIYGRSGHLKQTRIFFFA